MSGSATLIDNLTRIVSEAGAAILRARGRDLDARNKPDGSPVTAADEAANAIILAGLAAALPGIPVVSEESIQMRNDEPLGDHFVLVDPLDGTVEFIAGRDDYTVNIALIKDGQPVLGIVSAPALGRVWRGEVGRGADVVSLAIGAGNDSIRDRNPIQTRSWGSHAVALSSLSHQDKETACFLDALPGVERQSYGSSIKFCRIAEGSADIYPRFNATNEWDIAAGHAVLAASGGRVVGRHGETLHYGQAQRDFRVSSFLAIGDPSRLADLTRG